MKKGTMSLAGGSNCSFTIALFLVLFGFPLLYGADYYFSAHDFSYSFFGGKFSVECKNIWNEGAGCAYELRKNVQNVLHRMEKLGYWPHGQSRVRLVPFSKCTEELKRNISCFSGFSRDGKYDTFYLAVDDLKKEFASAVLFHEFAHALLSRHYYHMGRIPAEFFAVYVTQEDAGAEKMAQECFLCMSEMWNQPAVAAFGGNFAFPPGDYPAPNILAGCRYGQLVHFSKLLRRKYPEVFPKLWERLSAHAEKDGPVSSALLKEWMGKINPAARRLADKYYIFSESDGKVNLGMAMLYAPKVREKTAADGKTIVYEIVPGSSYAVFMVRGINAESEGFAEKGNFIAAVRRHGQITVRNYKLANTIAFLPPDSFNRGDEVQLRFASGNFETRSKIFIIGE